MSKKEQPVYVFLTRGEIHIHDETSLSIHLRPNDPRLKTIAKNIGKKLAFVTIDPKKPGTFKKFFDCNWYLIPYLKYSGSADHSGYTHFSFNYRFEKRYPWEMGDPVRTMTSEEIDKFKKQQVI